MEGNGSSGRTKEVPVDEALEQMARQAYDDGAATRMGDSPDTVDGYRNRPFRQHVPLF